MKKKLLSLLMVTALTASLVAGCGSNGDSKDKSSGSDRETKDVSELVIGEIEYSVIDDGGWAQSMHEGLVKACEDLGIDTKTNLLTMEEISEEDTSLIESTVEELVDEGADIIFGCSAGYSAILAELQQEYPDVIFAQQSNDVYDNIIEFQIRGYEGDFLTGYLSALMNEGSNQLGFCASMDEASVRTAINAYALGAKYDKAHGATLSAVWGSWAEYVYKNDEERFAHYAKKVWGVEEEDVAKAAKEGIRRTVEYFREIHMPTNLKELEIGEVSEEDLRELAMAATLNDTVKLSKIKELTAEDVYQIFRKAAGK